MVERVPLFVFLELIDFFYECLLVLLVSSFLLLHIP